MHRNADMNTEYICDCIATDHPALPGHFPGYPIVPGVVLLSRIAAAFARQTSRAATITEWPLVKFVSPLHPGEHFSITFEDPGSFAVKFVVRCDARLIASGSFTYVRTDTA